MVDFLKREEKKRLTAELIDDLITGPDPMEDYDKFVMLDMIIIEGLLFGLLYILSNLQDVVIAALSFTGLMGVIFIYTYFKAIKRNEAVAGKMFLESTTYIGDNDIVEQIQVEKYALLVQPAGSLDKEELVYDKDDLLETLTALKSPQVSVGGGPVHAPIIEELAKVKSEKIIDEFKRKQADKTSEHKQFFRKRKPKTDLSYLEDERDELFDIIDNIDFDLLDEEEDENGNGD